MTRKLSPIAAWLLMAGMLLSFEGRSAQSTTLKLQAQLVWGTNDDRSPDPKHKPVDADVKSKLHELPLKFTNYFEVCRKSVDVGLSSSNRITLSDKCDVEVRSLGGSNFEVLLYGKGKQVVNRKQAIAKGELLVMGGNAPNATAWLVVLKRLE